MADSGVFRINPLQAWQREAILKAAQLMRERFGDGPADPEAMAVSLVGLVRGVALQLISTPPPARVKAIIDEAERALDELDPARFPPAARASAIRWSATSGAT